MWKFQSKMDDLGYGHPPYAPDPRHSCWTDAARCPHWGAERAILRHPEGDFRWKDMENDGPLEKMVGTCHKRKTQHHRKMGFPQQEMPEKSRKMDFGKQFSSILLVEMVGLGSKTTGIWGMMHLDTTNVHFKALIRETNTPCRIPGSSSAPNHSKPELQTKVKKHT